MLFFVVKNLFTLPFFLMMLYNYIYRHFSMKDFRALNYRNFRTGLLVLLFIFLLTLNSCKTCNCPAYSKLNTERTEQNV